MVGRTVGTHTEAIAAGREAVTKTLGLLDKFETWLDDRQARGDLVYAGPWLLYNDGDCRWVSEREDWTNAVCELVERMLDTGDSDAGLSGDWYQYLVDQTHCLWATGAPRCKNPELIDLKPEIGPEHWEAVRTFLGIEDFDTDEEVEVEVEEEAEVESRFCGTPTKAGPGRNCNLPNGHDGPHVHLRVR